jgi:hypothetical protein
MDFGTIRLTIRCKLENGVLPTENAARVLGRSASGEACDGCGLAIGTGQLAIGGFARQPGGKALYLHLRCFEIWTQERVSLRRERERNAARPLSLQRQPA